MAELIELMTPKSTTIKINGNTLELVQYFGYKIEENKRPVFGFNNQSFSNTISGKKIASGKIGLKKTTIDAIASIAKKEFVSLGTDSASIDSVAKAFGFDTRWKDDRLNEIKANVSATNDSTISEGSFLDINPEDVILEMFSKDNAFTVLKDVNFLSKEGQVTIDKNTVLEVYSFIANIGG